MKKVWIIFLMTAFILTGCKSSVPDLSSADTGKTAEYMAGKVLKYNPDYSDGLQYDESVLEVTPSPVPTVNTVTATQKPQMTETPFDNEQGGSDTEETFTQVSLSELFAISGAKIDMISCSLKDSYGDSYEQYTASSGKKLLIVYFRIKNISGNPLKVNLLSKKIDYKLQYDDKSVGPQHTIAAGDMMYFNKTIKTGKSKQGILMFEVDSSVRTKDGKLVLTSGMNQSVIRLQK